MYTLLGHSLKTAYHMCTGDIAEQQFGREIAQEQSGW